MNTIRTTDSSLSLTLDVIRGAAALAVFYGHGRVLFIASAEAQDRFSVNWWLYVLSSFSHIAVILFFVLSGFLVGRSVVGSVTRKKWSWANYAIRRGVRLYVVLLPALIVSAVVDRLSLTTAANLPANHDTAIAIISLESVSERYTFQTFFGTLFFVQTILVPPFGSNTALWSLANEFWYYLLFPCFYIAVCPGTTPSTRIVLFCAGIAGSLFVGSSILMYFPIWLVGVAASNTPRIPFSHRTITAMTLFALLLLVVCLALAGIGKIPSELTGDYLVAIVLSCFLKGVADLDGKIQMPIISLLAHFFANISYTLYAVHLPVLILFRSCFTQTRAWAPNLDSWTSLGGVLLIVFLFAIFMYWVAEKHTDDLRERFLGMASDRARETN